MLAHIYQLRTIKIRGLSSTIRGFKTNQKVAIIGCGPSGLATLNAFKKVEEMGCGVPDIVVFDKQKNAGGVWNYTVGLSICYLLFTYILHHNNSCLYSGAQTLIVGASTYTHPCISICTLILQKNVWSIQTTPLWITIRHLLPAFLPVKS